MLCLGTEAIRQAAGVRPGESSQMPRRRYVGEHTLCDPLREGEERCCDRQSANEVMTTSEVPSSQMLCHPARFLCVGMLEHHCQFENAMAQGTGCHLPVFRIASVFMLPWEFPGRCAAKLPGDAVLFRLARAHTGASASVSLNDHWQRTPFAKRSTYVSFAIALQWPMRC